MAVHPHPRPRHVLCTPETMALARPLTTTAVCFRTGSQPQRQPALPVAAVRLQAAARQRRYLRPPRERPRALRACFGAGVLSCVVAAVDVCCAPPACALAELYNLPACLLSHSLRKKQQGVSGCCTRACVHGLPPPSPVPSRPRPLRPAPLFPCPCVCAVQAGACGWVCACAVTRCARVR